jgi:ubiquinone/menaquinone biosynthesis C-methylase UbiE
MTDFYRLEKHLDAIRKNITPDLGFQYHESLIDFGFRQFVEKHPPRKALDIGVGTGYSLEKFKKLGISAIGITQSDDEVKTATEKGYEVRFMDMAFLDFEDQDFDLVWCRHALEHSVMPVIALMEFERVLKPGGYLYVEVPSDNVMSIENASHFSLFSDESWQELFRRAGFRLVFRGQFGTVKQIETAVFHDIYWYYWLKKGNE